MKFSESWLRTMCNPVIDSAELCERLTMDGLEVEEVAPAAPAFDGVVVGRIESLTQHPNADRLLKLQIDLGFEHRQICAGVKQYYDPATLVGRQIIVVANLAPRAIRGEQSNGMLLAASAKEGETVTDVVLLAPGKPVPPGSTVG